LWAIDVSAETPSTRIVADDLGWPTSLGYAPGQQRLYVTDAKGKKIWALDCSGRCERPSVFLESDSLENPTTLAIAPDGSVGRVVHTFSGASRAAYRTEGR